MNFRTLSLIFLLFLSRLTGQQPATPQTFAAAISISSVRATAVDASGNLYLTGETSSQALPVSAGAFQPAFRPCPTQTGTTVTCSRAFVVKISPDGSRILYATYLGGSTGNDRATTIAVDSAGNAYVAGTTSSIDFPVTAGAYQARPSEGFVAKLNADGSALLASTYLTGAEPAALAVDAAGNAYVTGTTTLLNAFTTTPGTLQVTSPGDIDAFVLKLNPSLQTAIYSTFLGGELPDWGYGIAVDSEQNAYITGTTILDAHLTQGVRRVPVTAGAYTRLNPGTDAFISKLSPDGSRLLASTIIGGPQTDVGLAIAVDGEKSVYVAGFTGSSNFLEPGSIGVDYAFALKLSADFSKLVYSTTLPGRITPLTTDQFQIALRGDRLIVRHKSADPLLTTPGASRPCLASSGPGQNQPDQNYVLELNPAGNAAHYATYARNAYALTADSIFELSPDPDRLLRRTPLAPQSPGTLTCVANSATASEGRLAPGELVSIYGSNIGPEKPHSAELDGTGKLTTSLGGVEVRVNGQLAPLLYASSSQINAAIPFEIAGSGDISLQVIKDRLVVNSIAATAAEVNPGAFAIVNPNGTINSAATPAGPGLTVSAFMTGAGRMNPLPENGSVGKGGTRIAASVKANLRLYVAGKSTLLPLEVSYAGDAPGAVQGLVQVNLRLPDVLPNVLPTASAWIDLSFGNTDPVSVPVWVTP